MTAEQLKIFEHCVAEVTNKPSDTPLSPTYKEQSTRSLSRTVLEALVKIDKISHN